MFLKKPYLWATQNIDVMMKETPMTTRTTIGQKISRILLITTTSFFISSCGIFGSDTAVDSGSLEDKTTVLKFNGYLWRAALDTTSNFPIASVNAGSGVIITDWMTDPAIQNERVKVTVYILDAGLRADAVKVTVHRQELKDGQWIEAEVRANTAMRLEEAILTQARELRIRSIR
jgi:hypothetical protein